MMDHHDNTPPLPDVTVLPTKAEPAPSHLTGKWTGRRHHRLIFLSAVALILFLNLVVIVLAVSALLLDQRREGEVVAPLCLPCQEVEVVGEEERGWRRFRNGDRDLCCPLCHEAVASAVDQIYITVLKEQQQGFQQKSQPISDSYFRQWYGEPENTEEVVSFTNHYKPSAHVTGIQPYNADKYSEGNSSSDDSGLQIMNDWPLRFEPYRSTTQGHVGRLTWGLVAPASGLYRVYSMINFYFPYPQNSRDIRGGQGRQGRKVVHQLTLYHRAEQKTQVLAQRNTTLSTAYTDGLSSFLVTLQPLQVGDVISLSLSHSAARAVQDRWHAHGLFLVK